jgi:protein TonB
MSVGFLSSILIHLLVGVLGLGMLLARWDSAIMPAFRHGVSSVEVNLVTIPVNLPEPEPEPPPVEPEAVEVTHEEPEPASVKPEPVEVAPEEPEPVDEPEKPQQEIVLDEGVEQGNPEVTTDIKPAYPFGSRMRGEEGSVTLKIWIDADGSAKDIEVLQSSGYPALDKAGIKALRKAQFRDNKGRPVGSIETTLTFRFKLVE